MLYLEDKISNILTVRSDRIEIQENVIAVKVVVVQNILLKCLFFG